MGHRHQPIKSVKPHLGGCIVRLACGHGVFVAGKVIGPDVRRYRCLQSPCYQPNVFMADY